MTVRLDDRDRLVLATLLPAPLVAVNAALAGGWPLVTLTTFAVDVMIIAYIVARRDGLLARLGLFALAAGWTELLADAWAVRAGGLVYSEGGPFVASSPLYMPLAWATVLFQLGYLGLVLTRRFGLARASLAIAALGAVNLPLYEAMGAAADLWRYTDAWSLCGVPVYVMIAEPVICLTVPALVVLATTRAPRWSAALGVVLGLWMWGVGRAAWFLLA